MNLNESLQLYKSRNKCVKARNGLMKQVVETKEENILSSVTSVFESSLKTWKNPDSDNDYALDFSKYNDALGEKLATKKLNIIDYKGLVWMLICENYAFILKSSTKSYDNGRVLWSAKLFNKQGSTLSKYTVKDSEVRQVLSSTSNSLMLGGIKFSKVSASYKSLSECMGKLLK